MNNLKLFKIGVSWGGYESLVYSPGIYWQSSQVSSTPYSERISRLIRVSVGLEEPDDLLEDLSQALSLV